MQLSGLVPILATPFHADGSLDRPGLMRLVEFQLHAGVDGVATFGLASEAFALDGRERSEILRTVVDVVRAGTPGCPVVAGVMATGYAPALEQARHAVDLGADALMVLPPFLVPCSADQLLDFYGQLAVQTGVPVMVQDAPAATGVTMPVPLIGQLAALPGVQYVKVEAPPTAKKVSDVAKAVEGRMGVFGGQNAQFFPEEMERGALGTMPACELSDLLAPLVAAQRSGDRPGVTEGFTRLLPLLIYGLQSGIAWAVHKEILVRRGIIADARVRAPCLALDPASREGLERALTPFESEPSWVFARV